MKRDSRKIGMFLQNVQETYFKDEKGKMWGQVNGTQSIVTAQKI
jgi:hypothetical protein